MLVKLTSAGISNPSWKIYCVARNANTLCAQRISSSVFTWVISTSGSCQYYRGHVLAYIYWMLQKYTKNSPSQWLRVHCLTRIIHMNDLEVFCMASLSEVVSPILTTLNRDFARQKLLILPRSSRRLTRCPIRQPLSGLMLYCSRVCILEVKQLIANNTSLFIYGIKTPISINGSLNY